MSSAQAKSPLSTAARSATGLLALLAVAAVSSGCLFLRHPGSLFGGVMTMRVTTAPEMNRDMPVAVEVLVVYDQKVQQQVEKLTATQWFEGRSQFVLDHPPGTDTYESWKWEWVPRQSVPDRDMRYALGARATVVFVSYQTPGEHRAVLPPREDFMLDLQLNDFRITGLDP